MNRLFVDGSPTEQATGEERSYAIDFSNYSAAAITVSSPDVAVFDMTGREANDPVGSDVASTVMPTGSHGASGAVVTMKRLKALKLNHRYFIRCRVTDGDSNIHEAWLEVRCTQESD